MRRVTLNTVMSKIPSVSIQRPRWDKGTLNPGGIREGEGDFLATLACWWGGPVFEIGVEYGNSSAYIAFGLECDGSKLYSVDIQDVRQYRPDNQVFYLDRSVNVTPPEKCAWAFIDGDHSFKGVVADIEHCLKLGIDRLVFHDARIGDPCPDGNGQKGTDVYAAATYLLKEPEWRLTFIDSMCDLLVAEREGA